MDSYQPLENDGYFERSNTVSMCGVPLQNCPNCGTTMSAMPGTRMAVCSECGFKDPCCE